MVDLHHIYMYIYIIYTYTCIYIYIHIYININGDVPVANCFPEGNQPFFVALNIKWVIQFQFMGFDRWMV